MKNIKKKKLKKLFLFLISLGLFGIAVLLGINGYVRAAVKDRIITPAEASKLAKADCILILGAGIRKDNSPSPMLEDRLKQGIKLYKDGVSDRLLVSGDHGRAGYDEVNVMKQYAMKAGIPSENIFMDHAGFSTYESLYRARDIFKAHTVVIITQKYHIYRALYIGRGLGLKVYGIASDYKKYAGQSGREAREILARVKDFFYVVAKPKPTYLGDAVPVSGNGDITNDK